MTRLIALAVALAAAVPAHAASEQAAAGSGAAFAAALDLTVADLRRAPLDLPAPAAAPVASKGRFEFPFPFPFPDDRRPDDRRPGPGRPDDRRDVACYGSDNGWEEHRSGHGGYGWSPRQACEDCRRSHGSCRYSCSVQVYQCRAEWQGDDGSRRPYEGRPRRDRYDAEDEAVNRCRDAEWSNRTSGRCRPVDRRREDEVVENGRCG
jgi:hypothetical protein